MSALGPSGRTHVPYGSGATFSHRSIGELKAAASVATDAAKAAQDAAGSEHPAQDDGTETDTGGKAKAKK